MEKVKVSQKQFDWLEKYKSAEEIDYAIDIQPYRKRPDSPIVDWKSSEVARALHVGYEVEPEYKAGDWIYRKDDSKISQITQIDYSLDKNGAIFTDVYQGWLFKREVRHATPAEIAEEKERRFFDKHGRKPWELREGDLLISNTDIFSCDVKFVEASDDTGTLLVNGVKDEFLKSIDDVKNKYDILCFAESRLDRGDEHARDKV